MGKVKVSKYWKGVIAGAVPVAAAVAAAVDDGHIDAGEWIPIGIAILGALGVIAVPNKPAADADTIPGYGR
jgi:hypothetical protein